eukprot:1158243-Pelagomonas_calceolata.AAC.8
MCLAAPCLPDTVVEDCTVAKNAMDEQANPPCVHDKLHGNKCLRRSAPPTLSADTMSGGSMLGRWASTRACMRDIQDPGSGLPSA